MISALFTLIVYLLVLGILYWVVDYVLKSVPLPAPVAQLIRVVLVVILVLVVVAMLLGLIGVSTGFNMPRFTSGG